MEVWFQYQRNSISIILIILILTKRLLFSVRSDWLSGKVVNVHFYLELYWYLSFRNLVIYEFIAYYLYIIEEECCALFWFFNFDIKKLSLYLFYLSISINSFIHIRVVIIYLPLSIILITCLQQYTIISVFNSPITSVFINL